MDRKQLSGITADRKVINLKAFISEFKVGDPKKLRLPPRIWKKIAELSEFYSVPMLADELELAISTVHKNVRLYGNKKLSAPKTRKNEKIKSKFKIQRKLEDPSINLIELPPLKENKPETKYPKSEPNTIIAEITNRDGMTIRIFSGVDSESLKLLTSMA